MKLKGDGYLLIFFSRNECDQVAGELRKAGIQAQAYHAGLSDGQRTSIQERWINEDGCKVEISPSLTHRVDFGPASMPRITDGSW